MSLLKLYLLYDKGCFIGILVAIYEVIGFLSSVVISCAVLYKSRQAELVCRSLVTKQSMTIEDVNTPSYCL